MVLLKYKIDPSANEATINVTLSASPTLSQSDPDATLDLTLTLCKVSSGPAAEPEAATKPITIMVEKTVFEVHDPSTDGGLDILSQGAFGVLRSTSGDRSKSISLGHFRINGAPRSESPDLRERGHRFLTIPGDGTPVTVTHRLSWERILKYDGKRSGRADVRPGEAFEVSMRPGYLGTMWWCFGDLETDLRGKRLHVWHEGLFAGEPPDEGFVREGGWVLGREPMAIEWRDVTEGGKARFEVVE